MGHYDLIVLTFRQPFRGREQREGYLPSDTLWGALYATDAYLQGTPLPVENPYRVSSAFPFVGGEWLLPKPRVSAQAPETAQAGSSDKKKAKALNYVRLQDFLSLAAGQRLEHLDEALAVQRRALLPVAVDTPLGVSDRALKQVAQAAKRDANQLAQEKYGAGLSELSETEKLHLLRQLRGRSANAKAERQRNTQDRVTSQTDTFMTSGVTQPRMAFLLETTSPEQRTRLLAALRLLADTGLGGMRTQGSGQFDFEVQTVPEELQLRLRKADGPHILLGLTRPTAAEARAIENDPNSRYGLIRRDGFLDGTGWQRQDVWMMTEGSLVPGPLTGTLADVAPPNHPHPVWRSGLALSLGVEA